MRKHQKFNKIVILIKHINICSKLLLQIGCIKNNLISVFVFEILDRDGVTEEIVKTTDVFSGLKELSSKDVRSIVVVGKFGSSVFSTSRRISERFKLEEKWKSMECRYTNIPDNVEENTIIYVYGWFGMWNDDLCSVNNVNP